MQRQEFSYHYICNAIKDSELSVVSVPLCASSGLYSHIIYDYKFKDILYIFRRIYEVNSFNEREIMEKYCDDDSLNYILSSETNIPAIAVVNAESFDIEVEAALVDISTSKYLSIYQDMFLVLEECMSKLEVRKYELQDEYDEISNIYKRIKNATHPTIELYKIYKEKERAVPFYKFKEKKKWKKAMLNLSTSDDKKTVVYSELKTLKRKLKNNIELQENCGDEYLSLLSCQEYLKEYISSYRIKYMDILSTIKKSVMEALYEQKISNNYRDYNGREVIDSKSIS